MRGIAFQISNRGLNRRLAPFYQRFIERKVPLLGSLFGQVALNCSLRLQHEIGRAALYLK